MLRILAAPHLYVRLILGINMSAIMNHTKCQKCQRIFNVVELQENPDGIGKICIDALECEKRQRKNAQSNPELKPTR